MRLSDVEPLALLGQSDVALEVSERLPVGAVVLAAGAATRFGSPKQRLLLDRVLERARASRELDEIVVVAGAYELETDARLVQCPDWERGPGASLRCGLTALGDAAAAVVLLADGPDLSPPRSTASSPPGAKAAGDVRRGVVRRRARAPGRARPRGVGRRPRRGRACARPRARPVRRPRRARGRGLPGRPAVKLPAR